MKAKRILILGASGRTGVHLLHQALAAGYEVNILVRNSEKFRPHVKKLSVFEGTPTDAEKLSAAMEGCEAILSALNISRKSDFPWSALVTPDHFLSETARNIVDLAATHQIERVIVLSAIGVGDSRRYIPFWFKWLVDYSNIGVAYRDHERQEQVFADSALKYTVVRPAGLTNSDQERKIRVHVGAASLPGFTISRTDVARFMLEELENDSYLFRMPVISY